MTKIIPKILLIVLTILFLVNPNIVISSVNYSLNIFIVNVLPTLFPFFILSNFIISYNVIDLFSNFINLTISKLFKISKYSSLVFILSMFSGHPSNAKYIENLLNKNLIDINQATKLLTITFFPSPMFVIGTVGIMFYNNISIGIILLISVYLTNIILGIILRNKKENKNIKFNQIVEENFSFSSILKSSILSSCESLLLILGNIMIFVLMTNILFNYINFNPILTAIISGLLEITNGLKLISLLEINLNIKIILSSSILYLSGICILSQAFSILDKYKINYKYVLKYKLVGLVINVIITYTLLFLF